MAANDYTRTVNITPLGTAYSWDTPPSWITINQVGTSNDWTITVAANSGAARSATLTVRHNNTTTTDTISVSQAGGTVITPTATPVSPTATPIAPTPTSPDGAGPTPTPTDPQVLVISASGGSTPISSISLSDFEGGPGTGTTTVTWSYNSSGSNAVPVVISKDSRINVSFVYGTYINGNTVGSMTVTSNDLGSATPVSIQLSDLIVARPDNNSVTATLDVFLTQGTSGGKELISPTPTSGSGAGPTATPFPTFAVPTSTPYVGGGGGGGGCHLAGDLLTLANGETKRVEDIVLGDTLLSLAINGLSDIETIYKEFNVSAADYSDEYTSAVVNDIYVDTYSSYYDINNGELQLTLEHPVLVKTPDDRVVFKVIKNVLVGDSMLNQNNEWVLVNSNVLVQTEAPFTTYAFNVENKDVYFASGILVHNVFELVDSKDEILNQL